mgnify:CR=1 FL=1
MNRFQRLKDPVDGAENAGGSGQPASPEAFSTPPTGRLRSIHFG